jgi:hypothetical protein
MVIQRVAVTALVIVLGGAAPAAAQYRLWGVSPRTTTPPPAPAAPAPPPASGGAVVVPIIVVPVGPTAPAGPTSTTITTRSGPSSAVSGSSTVVGGAVSRPRDSRSLTITDQTTAGPTPGSTERRVILSDTTGRGAMSAPGVVAGQGAVGKSKSDQEVTIRTTPGPNGTRDVEVTVDGPRRGAAPVVPILVPIR